MLVEADETIQTMAYATTINGTDRVVIALGDYEYVLDPKRAMALHHDLSHVLERFKPSDLWRCLCGYSYHNGIDPCVKCGSWVDLPNAWVEPRRGTSRSAPCSCSPCPVPTDPEQRLDITCAHCGVAIDFRRGEVYVNGPSYVCKLHTANDKADTPSEGSEE